MLQVRNQQTQIDFIRLKLDHAENSGFISETKTEILKQSKKLLHGYQYIKPYFGGRYIHDSPPDYLKCNVSTMSLHYGQIDPSQGKLFQ